MPHDDESPLLLHLELQDLEGRTLERTPEHAPLELGAAQGQILPAIEQVARTLQVGEERTLTLPPEQAFGPRMEQLILRIPRDQIPADAKVGTVLQVDMAGRRGLITVLELDAEHALLDTNHPLAGQSLVVRMRRAAGPEDGGSPADSPDDGLDPGGAGDV